MTPDLDTALGAALLTFHKWDWKKAFKCCGAHKPTMLDRHWQHEDLMRYTDLPEPCARRLDMRTGEYASTVHQDAADCAQLGKDCITAIRQTNWGLAMRFAQVAEEIEQRHREPVSWRMFRAVASEYAVARMNAEEEHGEEGPQARRGAAGTPDLFLPGAMDALGRRGQNLGGERQSNPALPRGPGHSPQEAGGGTTMAGILELHNEASGLRHYLDGKPLHAGAAVELQLDDGTWLPGRYEWSFNQDEPAVFHFGIAHFVSGDADAAVRLPQGAILRRPGMGG